jgi:ribonucleoside-triphosphate reductase
MRTLEEVDRDLAAARETLLSGEGTPAEVYSRIVGYYRSVRNWNRGKREEYSERKLFDVSRSLAVPGNGADQHAAVKAEISAAGTFADEAFTDTSFPVFAEQRTQAANVQIDGENKLLLFVRSTCPACPSAKTAAAGLGIPVDLVNADTETGLAEAAKRNVFSTPTAILLSGNGMELGRAQNPQGIKAFAQAALV